MKESTSWNIQDYMIIRQRCQSCSEVIDVSSTSWRVAPNNTFGVPHRGSGVAPGIARYSPPFWGEHLYAVAGKGTSDDSIMERYLCVYSRLHVKSKTKVTGERRWPLMVGDLRRPGVLNQPLPDRRQVAESLPHEPAVYATGVKVLDIDVNVERVQELGARIRESVQKVIVGKAEVIDLAIITLLCRGHILAEDVPGIGKTTLSKALAQALGCTFRRIQFTPDLMPNDVLGVNFFNQKTSDFEFHRGPIFSQVLLADEINRATPRTQAALLEAMQENQSTIDGVTMPLPSPFLVIATQNPIEMEGTFPLPEAQLDRFMTRIKLGYPSEEEESAILLRFEHDTTPPDLDAVTESTELKAMQSAVTDVRVDDVLRSYIVTIVRQTRESPGLSLGASPRAGLALYKTAQARAALDGRNFVTPDDIKSMAPHVLPHRMLLNSNSRLRGHTTEQIVNEILSAAPVPIER